MAHTLAGLLYKTTSISGGSAGNLSDSISSIGYYNYLGVQASMFFDYVNQYRYL